MATIYGLDLFRSIKEKQLEYQHGAGLAIDWRIYKDSCQLLIQQLDSPQNLLLGSECLAIDELGRCGPLPLPDNGDSDSSEQSKLSLVTKLLSLVKSNKTSMKVRVRAALATGICIKYRHKQCCKKAGRHDKTKVYQYLPLCQGNREVVNKENW